ncbi:MAG TPA: hypothetical protein H9874_07230 [Candidatus Bilophila faecipullorum]|uniref:Chorismate mutase n=1 Tax=Candidatus Bilophila faecipullorum TaxID=2838482 RepID=A0A9D1QZI3_9BACT|nr:hypothetical protein [uncultured Bilophila sp.]HIW78921.1 hypothetical protein [Candidatus Bilophila faecipullorum]
MTIKSHSSRESRNPRDFNDPRNKPQERSERPERPERSEWASRRSDRPEGATRERTERSRPDWAVRTEQRRSPRERFEGGDRPRPPRGAGLLAELRELDRDLIKMIARRSRMLTRLPASGASDHERELRTSWEEHASAVSRDPKLIRQIFALLQEVEVAPADMEQPTAFNLAPMRKPVNVDLPAPASDRLPRVHMTLAASGASECVLHGVPLNNPVMECLKGLNQVGARLRWEEDGRILCQGGEPVSGYSKSILDKVVHVGDDPFNLFLILFQMVTRPARLKIIGESGLKFVDLAPLRHFLPLLGARLTSVVPGQEGLPARLESSAMLPSEVAVPADLPADAVEALLIAAAGWERPVTMALGEHPEGRSVASKMLPILRDAGIEATLTDAEGALSLHVVPGKAHFGVEPGTGINLSAAAALLALPALAGGSVKLRGAWDATGDDQTREGVRELFAAVGLDMRFSADCAAVSFGEGLGEDAELPPLKPLTDLSGLPSSLFPVGLVLALIPAVRAKGGDLPRLPQNTDMTLVESFLNQLGLSCEDGRLVSIAPASTPWASPSFPWALALSLAAFLRPNIKLVNPGIVTNHLPWYWNAYNSLPTPSLARKSAEEEAAPAPSRPARRRVLASHTPESEMPDEIVYPDED